MLNREQRLAGARRDVQRWMRNVRIEEAGARVSPQTAQAFDASVSAQAEAWRGWNRLSAAPRVIPMAKG